MFKSDIGILMVRAENGLIEIGAIHDFRVACQTAAEEFKKATASINRSAMSINELNLRLKPLPKPKIEDWQAQGKRSKPRLK